MLMIFLYYLTDTNVDVNFECILMRWMGKRKSWSYMLWLVRTKIGRDMLFNHTIIFKSLGLAEKNVSFHDQKGRFLVLGAQRLPK